MILSIDICFEQICLEQNPLLTIPVIVIEPRVVDREDAELNID